MKFPEKYRVKNGLWKTMEGDDFGLFFIPLRGKVLKAIAAHSDMEWEHVSVSLPDRVPTWSEMCVVKELFWEDNQTVIQFHPKKSEYINNCRTCLHLWRHKSGHDLPPKELVGISVLGELK